MKLAKEFPYTIVSFSYLADIQLLIGRQCPSPLCPFAHTQTYQREKKQARSSFLCFQDQAIYRAS